MNGTGAAPRTAELPLLHRLVLVYLALPLVVWLIGWFEWWFGIPAAAMAAAALWPALSGSWRGPRSLPLPAFAALAAIALAWTMLTGAGGFLDQINSDWFKHRALLADLSSTPWPAFLSDEGTELLQGEGTARTPLLRYNLGYYMVPALAAKWFGAEALAWAVRLWTWAGATLLLASFASSISSRAGKAVAAAAILAFFSGMDIVRWLVLEDLSWDYLLWHIEGNYALGVATQYSSNMSGLMWVPQHFIAAGLGAVLLIEARRRERLAAAIGVVCAAIGFWSVFAAVGLIPLLAALLAEKGIRPFLRWQNLVAAPLLAALVAAYLTSDSSGVERGWLWSYWSWDVLAKWLPLFIAVEFLALAAALLFLRPEYERDPFFLASAAALLVLPLFRVGDSNDLCMRASFPALVTLCWLAARALLDGPGETTAPLRAGGRRRVRFARVLVVAMLAAGAVTPLVEVARSVANSDPGAVDPGFAEIATATFLDRPQQYVAYEIPRVLNAVLKDPAGP